jgi:hypothetical protein
MARSALGSLMKSLAEPARGTSIEIVYWCLTVFKFFCFKKENALYTTSFGWCCRLDGVSDATHPFYLIRSPINITHPSTNLYKWILFTESIMMQGILMSVYNDKQSY